MSVYDLGDVVSLAVAITDSTGAAANAGAVTCTITLPDDTTDTGTVTNTAVGQYAVVYTPPQSGRYTVEWVATGANASAFVDTFTVAAPGIPTAPATYSGDPATSDLDQVRFLIRDTMVADALFTDSEINWLITEWIDPYVAAWNAADVLVARYAQLADTSKKVGDLSLSTSYGSKADQYRALATRLQLQAGRKSTPLITDTGADTEQVFTMGMFDGT